MSKHRGISHMPDTEELIDPAREIRELGGFISRAEISAIFNSLMSALNALNAGKATA